MAASRRALLSSVAVGGGLVLALWSSARPSAHVPIGTSVTWNRDVLGILERRCLACHRDDGPAPMSLESYDVARPWARAIREEVLERRMPPSRLRSGAGLYENARVLSLAEIELLVSWADGGAPKGTGEEPKPAPLDHTHWNASVPGTVVPGDANALQRTIRVPVPKGWIDEWTFDPGAWPAVSAVLRLNGRDVIGNWTAGDPPVRYPEGAGLQVPSPEALTIDVTLARPLTDDILTREKPTLHVTRASSARRPVVHHTMQQAAPPRLGELLLALKLDLERPDASADVYVTRKSGEEEFLMSMGPPGASDSISYRLREPLALRQGDTVQVRSESKFSLDLETLRAARVSAGQR
jgi:hypothetical protein